MTTHADRSRAESLTRQALTDFGRESGRSALVRVCPDGGEAFTAGLNPDVSRPAASLLKVLLGLAAEDALRCGALDTDAPVVLAELPQTADSPSLLRVFSANRALNPAEVIGLMLSVSDNDCAAWLLKQIGLNRVRAAADELGCANTDLRLAPVSPGGPLLGSTTAVDALRMLSWLGDRRLASKYPITANALRNSLHNSRIPLGVTNNDAVVAHKTGTLHGVANDVAFLGCSTGVVEVAFLADSQHDTLVTGYDMGLCVQSILAAWGLGVHHTKALP